jgi:AhpD family alkylhydroperoxidase
MPRRSNSGSVPIDVERAYKEHHAASVEPPATEDFMESAHDIQRNLAEPVRGMREQVPDVFEAFKALDQAVMMDGVLSPKVKHLIALAIAVTKQCDGCIAAHARGAARQHATELEVAEAMAVTVLMNGGPGTVWGPRALAAYREFSGAASDPSHAVESASTPGLR